MELESLICDYLDGSLKGEAREDLETRLAMDANARELLASQRRLDELLIEHLPAVGELDWDRLAARIAAAVTAASKTTSVAPVFAERSRAGRGRLALYPRGLSLRALRSGSIAAALLIAVGTAVHFVLTRSPHTVVTVDPGPVLTVSQVSGPQVESAAGGIAEVTIGPAKSMASSDMTLDESDDLISRPSRVVIASGIIPEQDRTGLPY